ncbi:MAG: hypothetical protein ACFE0P_06525 [Oceanicaulis sp.]
MGVVKAFGGWFVASVFLALAGTVLSGAMVLAMLHEVGAEIGSQEITTLIMSDLTGFAPLYGAFIAAALAAAFLAGALVTRFIRPLRGLVFTLAGAVAMAVMLILMEQVFFGVQLIAGARTLPGFLLQVAAGGAAGFLYAALTPAPNAR